MCEFTDRRPEKTVERIIRPEGDRIHSFGKNSHRFDAGQKDIDRKDR